MDRNIHPLAEEFINLKLVDNSHAAQAYRDKDPRALFIEVCKTFWGVREETGNNDGVLIEAIQKTIGGSYNEPWCMALMQTCLAYVEKNLKVISPVESSEHCGQVWAKTNKRSRVRKYPAPGAIAIWNYQGTDKGHCGCVIDTQSSDFFITIEGNTEGGIDPEGKIIREGGGVYFSHRSFDPKGSMKLLGFLKPF
jgi:hypothetical protein